MNPIFSKFENIFADFSGALLFGYFFIIISQKLQHRGSSSEGKLFSLVLCIIDIHKTGHGLKSGNPRVYFDTDGGLKGGGGETSTPPSAAWKPSSGILYSSWLPYKDIVRNKLKKLFLEQNL